MMPWKSLPTKSSPIYPQPSASVGTSAYSLSLQICFVQASLAYRNSKRQGQLRMLTAILATANCTFACRAKVPPRIIAEHQPVAHSEEEYVGTAQTE